MRSEVRGHAHTHSFVRTSTQIESASCGDGALIPEGGAKTDGDPPPPPFVPSIKTIPLKCKAAVGAGAAPVGPWPPAQPSEAPPTSVAFWVTTNGFAPPPRHINQPFITSRHR